MSVTQRALLLVGTPYKRDGRSPPEGFDCFTLLEYVRRIYYRRATPHAGIPADDIPATQAAALAIYRATGGREHIASPWVECDGAEGCAVALGRSRFGRLHHCGVMLDGGVLHALESTGTVYTPLERVGLLYSRVEFFECRS